MRSDEFCKSQRHYLAKKLIEEIQNVVDAGKTQNKKRRLGNKVVPCSVHSEIKHVAVNGRDY